MRGTIAAALALLGITNMAAAQTAPAFPCIKSEEMEALVLTLSPDLLRTVGRVCARHVAADSPFVTGSGALIASLEAERDAAWPLARSAFIRLAKVPEADAAMLSDPRRVSGIISGTLTRELAKTKAEDCQAIDRMMRALDPLPARNFATLVTALIQVSSKKDRAKSSKPQDSGRPDFSICPAELPTTGG